MIDTTPALLHSALSDGDIDFFNQRMLDYLGAPMEELCGWQWANFIHPDDVEQIVSKGRCPWKPGSLLRVKQGCGVRMKSTAGDSIGRCPLRDQAGNIVKWFGSSIDVDDRKRADDVRHKRYDEIKALKD